MRQKLGIENITGDGGYILSYRGTIMFTVDTDLVMVDI